MPRRKIGADLKEALCKLYEAGDITADTIEKHGIMSRATFFRNLKVYKTGASLEQRHSTGRKTNADKLKEHERQELDALKPAHLSELELVLLLEDDDKAAQELAMRSKRKGKAAAGSSKRNDPKGATADEPIDDAAQTAAESGSESDGDMDESTSLARRQALEPLAQAARSFLTAHSSLEGGETSTSLASADLDSLLNADDSHYSNSNRGALFVVRSKRKPGQGIIAAVALRSLIWSPDIYQALGPSYASRSIDKIGNLARLRVDPEWQHRGIGHWLVRVAELKASKLGFSHLYTQSDADNDNVLSFWRTAGFNEFVRLDNIARLEKAVMAPLAGLAGERTKRPMHSPPESTRTDGPDATGGSSSKSSSKKRRMQHKSPESAPPERVDRLSAIPTALDVDPAIPLEATVPLQTSSEPSTAAALESLKSSKTTPQQGLNTSMLSSALQGAPAAPSVFSVVQGDSDGSSNVSALPTRTPHTAVQSSNEAPPRRIAFQEPTPTDDGPSA